MDVTTSFKIGAAVWDGDKFLIETATEGGNKQIKVTAEVVKAYLGGSGGSGGGLDMRVLPFTGIVEDMEVKQESVAGGAYGLGIYYVRSRGCFAAAPLGMLSGRPISGALNWEGRELYEDADFIPRQGNLYVCSSDDKGYWYNGVSLRQLASVETGEVQGESLSGAEIDAAVSGANDVALLYSAVHNETGKENGTTDGTANDGATTNDGATANDEAKVNDGAKANDGAKVNDEARAGRATVTTVTRAAVVTTEAPKATLTEITRKADIETITN
ncbi:MAG: hypothetical protein ACOCNW_01565 [Prevotella sp.]